MKLRITQEYYMKVVPEWYDKELLSGIGTLEQQIIHYELGRIEKNDNFFKDLLKGETTIMILERDEPIGCIHCFSKTCDGSCSESEKPDEEPSYYEL